MKKVVVAEASPTIKSVADSLLRQNGYDVVCTSDGLQAWEVISAEKPDLVLVGQGISGISGIDLCRQISSDRLTGGIPVVLMLGAKDTITEEEIVTSGARGRLRKPFSPKDLLDVAERLAGQTQANIAALRAKEEASRLQTKYNTQVSSTQHLQPEKEPYNLEWLDLNETKVSESVSKVTSFDISAENQGLVIDNDQYGLSNPPLEPEPEPEPVLEQVPVEKDEDYEWFLGEIKKEMEGKGKFENQIVAEIPKSPINSSIMTANPSPGPLKFDDIASAETPHRPVIDLHQAKTQNTIPSAVFSKPNQSLDLEVGGGIAPVTETLCDGDLARLADQIASKLAVQIAAKIDRSQIIDAIKAALKQ